jgi:YebC/PmpR family DNA-binding regulatory protein
MGRIFETRKATMFARWDKMAKMFTRVSKEIMIAVKAGGSNPESNPALRRAVQNARACNMPKDKVENAIKKASGQGAETFEEILYEGYGPHGIALLIETATDNSVRTVANLRSHFNKKGGNLGSSGSVIFNFKRMGVFRLHPEGVDVESLELDLIDYGLEEMGEGTGEKGDPQLIVRCDFQAFGEMQKAIEERKLSLISAASEYIPLNMQELSEAEAEDVMALVDRIEQDDDVQRVFHNLA